MATSPYLTLVLTAAVVGMGVSFLVWLHRDTPGAAPLAVFVTAASLSAVAEGVELAVADLGLMRTIVQVELTLSVVIPLAWLVTILEYSGRSAWLTRRRLGLLLVEPALFAALVWSNAGHALVWEGAQVVTVRSASAYSTSPGLVFWGHLAYSYALIAVGGLILLGMIVRANRLYRGQATALLVAIALPTVATAAEVFAFVPPGLDPTSLGYVASGFVLSAAIVQRRLLDVVPVARDFGREAVFAELDDPVLIVDERERIVDANGAARSLFDWQPGEFVGRRLADVDPLLTELIPEDGTGEQSELALSRDGAVRHFDVRVSTLYRAHGAVSGAIVSLRDVTDRRQREQRLDVLNRLLRHNLRNEMNVVRGNLDMLAEAVEDEEWRLDRIRETIESVVERSGRVGRVTEALDREDRRPHQLVDLVESVVNDVREAYPSATISVSVPDGVQVDAGPSLTLALRELVENAVEHGGEDPSIVVAAEAGASDARSVVIRVIDDGPGIDPHEREVITAGEETPLKHASGVGLWIAHWIVRSCGGTLSFEDVDDGTTVVVTLPTALGDAEATGGSQTPEPVD